LKDEYGEVEWKPRQFDLNMKYGPSIGLSRLEKWERAKSYGKDPPGEIGDLLSQYMEEYVCMAVSFCVCTRVYMADGWVYVCVVL